MSAITVRIMNLKKVLIYLTFFLTLLIVIEFVWWLNCVSSAESLNNAITKYLSVFPGLLKSVRLIAWVRFLLGAFSLM